MPANDTTLETELLAVLEARGIEVKPAKRPSRAPLYTLIGTVVSALAGVLLVLVQGYNTRADAELALRRATAAGVQAEGAETEALAAQVEAEVGGDGADRAGRRASAAYDLLRLAALSLDARVRELEARVRVLEARGVAVPARARPVARRAARDPRGDPPPSSRPLSIRTSAFASEVDLEDEAELEEVLEPEPIAPEAAELELPEVIPDEDGERR